MSHLLISTRPALHREGSLSVSDRVLDDVFCDAHDITEWCWPAFTLSTDPAASQAMAAWFETAVAGVISGATALVVCVSPGSLELLHPLMPSPWPGGVRLGLMGDGSAAKAVSMGIPADVLIHPRGGLGQTQDSAGLLECLRQASPFDLGLLLKGNGGNAELAPALGSLCKTLTVQTAYSRVAYTIEQDRLDMLGRYLAGVAVEGTNATPDNQPVTLYLTSSEAAAVMAPVLTVCRPDNLRVLVTHPKIQSAAVRAGFTGVQCIAPGAEVLRARILPAAR